MGILNPAARGVVWDPVRGEHVLDLRAWPWRRSAGCGCGWELPDLSLARARRRRVSLDGNDGEGHPATDSS